VAGLLEATEVAGAEPDFGRKVATSQCSLRGVKVTLSPLIPETRRPLTVVLPEPRRELSGIRTRSKGPPLFWTWTMSWSGAFSTV
jgi:hypothetical protein